MKPGSGGWRRAVADVVAWIESRGRWVFPALLLVATFAAFLPVLGNGFVGDWDDGLNFARNPAYRGLGWRELHWMFTTFHLGHYMLLASVTFGLDYVLWGLNPAGYHLTALVLHMANTVIFYALAGATSCSRPACSRETDTQPGSGRRSLRRSSRCIPSAWSRWHGRRNDGMCCAGSSTCCPCWRICGRFRRHGLSPLYELPYRIEPASRSYVVAALVVAAVSVGVFALRRRWPALVAA